MGLQACGQCSFSFPGNGLNMSLRGYHKIRHCESHSVKHIAKVSKLGPTVWFFRCGPGWLLEDCILLRCLSCWAESWWARAWHSEGVLWGSLRCHINEDSGDRILLPLPLCLNKPGQTMALSSYVMLELSIIPRAYFLLNAGGGVCLKYLGG